MINLQKRRKALKLSQSRLAAISGVHASDISRFESGRLIPYPGQLKKLLEALGLEEDAGPWLMQKDEKASKEA